ncbi:MAG: enolase C-terminal domain-like protein [Paracoccus sp. (in: a-proteobacteria)]
MDTNRHFLHQAEQSGRTLTIRQAVAPVKVATGEMCQNRIMFKQFIAGGAIDVVQIDACRLGGLNEVLAVQLMAAKYGLPVWPHAGGVGLCEYA